MTRHHKQQQKNKTKKKNTKQLNNNNKLHPNAQTPHQTLWPTKQANCTSAKVKIFFFSVWEMGPLFAMAVTMQGTQLLTHNTVKTNRPWKNICTWTLTTDETRPVDENTKAEHHEETPCQRNGCISQQDVCLSRKHPDNEESQVQRVTHRKCAEPAEPWREWDGWSQGWGGGHWRLNRQGL